VSLIGKFVSAVNEGRSVCHQMIMGAGKVGENKSIAPSHKSHCSVICRYLLLLLRFTV
jgi:hypothetical protein